jgi:hypothetical protein
MKNSSLHEVAKFAAGVVAADFLWLLWFSQQHLNSVSFFGMSVTSEMLLPNLIFDIALFIMLVHYAWNIGRIPAMRERSYIFLAGCIFTFVAILHLWRVFTGVDLQLGDWDAPVWLSWFGVGVTTYLAYMSFTLVGRIKGK